MDEKEKDQTPPKEEPPQPEPQPEPSPEEKPEEKPEESFKSVIMEIKAGYENQLKDLENKYQSRLNEREEVIKQILSGNPKQPAPTTATAFEEINEKRKFNIW